MPVLYRASLSYVLRHPWQLGLALVGIVAGVAVMVAIDLANSSSRTAFLMSMDAVNGRTTHQVIGGPGGLDEQLYSDLRLSGEFREIAPVVQGYVDIENETMQLLGVDIFAEQGIRGYSRAANVRGNESDESSAALPIIRSLLTVPGALVLAESTADRLGFAVGDRIHVRIDGREHVAILAGIFDDTEIASSQGIVIADISQVQAWLGMQGYLTRIDARLANDTIAVSLESRLPAGARLVSAEGRTQATVAMSKAFTTNLAAMSLLAMLVGIFLIYNSVAFAVLQRRSLFGVLRALGVSRRQVLTVIMSEAAALGIAGSLLGILAGITLGEQLVVLVSRTISDHYFVANVTEIVVDADVLAKGMLAGVCATLIAAGMPAAEGTLVPPRLAMLRSTVERGAGRLLPYVSMTGLALIAAATVILVVSGKSLFAGLVAVFAVILGIALLIPRYVIAAVALIEPLARRLGGTVASLATGGIGMTLSRTGVAIVALAIAVSATIGVSIMVDSFRLSVGKWLGDTLQSDVYIGVARGSLDQALLGEIVAVPGISEYSTSRRAWLEDETGKTRIIALQMASGSYAGIDLRSENDAAVWQQFNESDGILVSDPFAYKRNVDRGDRVTLHTRQGPQDFEIAAVYLSYDSNDGSVIMNRGTYDRYFGDPGVDSIGLYLSPGYSTDETIERIRALAAGRQSLLINSNARIREMSLNIFDRTFVITNVLYWLAVGVAIVGILGAMLALQLERAREFGILRAVGMTPWQLGRLVTGQSALMGLLSGIAAVPIGIAMAILLIEVINRRAFGWQMDIHIGLAGLGSAILLAITAAFCAGIYPALRAGRARPALAMREE